MEATRQSKVTQATSTAQAAPATQVVPAAQVVPATQASLLDQVNALVKERDSATASCQEKQLAVNKAIAELEAAKQKESQLISDIAKLRSVLGTTQSTPKVNQSPYLNAVSAVSAGPADVKHILANTNKSQSAETKPNQREPTGTYYTAEQVRNRPEAVLHRKNGCCDYALSKKRGNVEFCPKLATDGTFCLKHWNEVMKRRPM
jgi:hypothetical protein